MQKLKSTFVKYKYLFFSIQRIIIAVGFFYLGFFFCAYVFLYRDFFVLIISSLATLVAAFCGAWFAFLLQSKSKKEENINRQISASNRAIFTLYQRINKLRLYQREVIDPYRQHPAIFLAIRASRDFEKDDTFFDIDTGGLGS
jgi:hypothetical protein